jgi:membrane protease YdiL (CAAX protease family)
MHPSFMTFEPLSDGRYWILFAWLPFWVFNIMGEEILWRGVLLPRQEIVFGKSTWIFHGFFWMIFHIAFGLHLVLSLIPIFFIQSYIVQKRKNSWIGVLIHAGLNGPGFIAVAFGLI